MHVKSSTPPPRHLKYKRLYLEAFLNAFAACPRTFIITYLPYQGLMLKMAYIANSVLVGVVGALLYFYQAKRSRATVAHQHGCKLPLSYSHLDPFFGLDLKLQEIKRALKFQNIPFNAALFQKYGKTFEVNVFGKRTLRTIEPENLQTVYATNNKDWGYEPIRLPVMEPFCGRGFITSDGESWKNARALLRVRI